DNIARPLGLDFHIGLGADGEARCADALGARPPAPGAHNILTEIAKHPDSLTARAFGNPPGLMRSTVFNSHRWRAAEIPSANGHGDARSLARLYGALAIGGALDGVRILSEVGARRCYEEQARGPDLVLPADTRFSFGFMMTQPEAPFGPNPDNFGHPGAGGSIGFADPAAGIGFGYVMNRMGPEIVLDPRPRALIDALYESL
ncbi:MAG: serine hydrolase, partial [Candidatus Binataceae bacterium]